MIAPFRPEALTPERSRAWRLAVRHLRRGAAGHDAALGALTEVGYTPVQAANIVRTMLAQGNP